MDTKFSSDIAFTPSVKAVQAGRGSRKAYAEFEARGGFRTQITPDLIALLSEVDTAYLATANAAGQPYAQHRAGRRASSMRSTRPRWASRITSATGNTSHLETWPRTTRPSYS